MESTIHPVHTLGHIDCPACEGLRALYSRSLSASMSFSEAADLYIQLRTLPSRRGRYIRQATETSYRQYLKSLGLFFGQMALADIKWYHLKAYQDTRLAGVDMFVRYRRPQDAKPRKLKDGSVLPPKGKQPCPTKPAHVNQELCLLNSILRRAGAWTGELEENYEELDEEYPENPQALTLEEQNLWLNVSRSAAKWKIVHLYSLLAFDTTCSTNELRHLRLADVNLHHQTICIPSAGTKTAPRNRTIVVESGDAIWALQELLKRASEKGSNQALHYLFPLGSNRTYDPTKPMSNSGLKKRWAEVRLASGLLNFTPYDCRHTGITRMAESGYPIPVIMARAGHLSPRMTQHYTQVSLAAQRHWAKVAHDRRLPVQDEYRSAPSWGYQDLRVG